MSPLLSHSTDAVCVVVLFVCHTVREAVSHRRVESASRPEASWQKGGRTSVSCAICSAGRSMHAAVYSPAPQV